jgi:hypothetical protein
MASAKKLGEVSWQHFKDDTEGGPSPRSGHSITVTGGGSKTVVFGGCGVSNTGDKQEIFSETWLLDISGDAPKWDLADVMGDVPPARWRHTATLLPDQKNVLIFGGLNKGKRFNDTYVLSIDKMEWNIKECAGTPPHPRSHHTANLIEFEPDDELELPKQRVCVIGGYGGPGTSRDYFMDVNMLELDTWSWTKIANVRGPQPKPRSDHCACLTRGILIVSGGRGWSTGKTDPGFYNDIHCLDLKKSKPR